MREVAADRDARAGTLLADAVARLRRAGADSPERDARLMLVRALDRPGAWVFANREAEVAAAGRAAFEAMLARREAREPLAHILGQREFWSLPFAVTPDVLVPRPDSEAVIEAVLAQCPDRERAWRILDLGTGSGCLLLALLSEYPQATGLGVDASEAALAVAAGNGRGLGLDARVEWRCGDWTSGIDDRFDIVVSNPPYIETSAIGGLAPEVARHDPRHALDGGADGLDAYRALIAGLGRVLGPGSVVALELGEGQAADVGEIARANGLRNLDVRCDLAGRARALVLTPENVPPAR
jgi:release factor glutamine methyltransferase